MNTINTKLIFIIVGVVLLVGLAWWFSQNESVQPTTSGVRGFAPASIILEQHNMNIDDDYDEYGCCEWGYFPNRYCTETSKENCKKNNRIWLGSGAYCDEGKMCKKSKGLFHQ